MAEIKLNDNFATEVNAFRSAGAELDTVKTYQISSSGLSLPAVSAFQDCLHNIGSAMYLFKLLTEKDAKDMEALAAKLKAADSAGC